MDFTSLLDKSPGAIAVLLAVIGLFLSGKVVTEAGCDKREAKVLAQLDVAQKASEEWKDLYLAAIEVGQRGVSAAERRIRGR